MEIDRNKIEQRKEGRALAVDVVDLIKSCLLDHTGNQVAEGFWDALRKAFPDQLAKPISLPKGSGPMTEKEAIRFENEIVPRGAFRDSHVYEVPMNYWHRWWIEDVFTEELRRYVLSDRAKKRTREEE